jgi:hypothetical protein
VEDEGAAISYQVLDSGVSVLSSEGDAVGTVEHVVAAPAQDIFHGIVIHAGSGRRFVAADQIAALHERGVDLRISADEVADLPQPHGAAAVRRVREPGVKPSRWKQILDLIEGANPRREDWTDE